MFFRMSFNEGIFSYDLNLGPSFIERFTNFFWVKFNIFVHPFTLWRKCFIVFNSSEFSIRTKSFNGGSIHPKEHCYCNCVYWINIIDEVVRNHRFIGGDDFENLQNWNLRTKFLSKNRNKSILSSVNFGIAQNFRGDNSISCSPRYSDSASFESDSTLFTARTDICHPLTSLACVVSLVFFAKNACRIEK